jgi:hypothetical protein
VCVTTVARGIRSAAQWVADEPHVLASTRSPRTAISSNAVPLTGGPVNLRAQFGTAQITFLGTESGTDPGRRGIPGKIVTFELRL